MQALMQKMQSGEGSGMTAGAPRSNQIEDELSVEAKKWITVYPIYFDAKRKYMKGCRRVSHEHSCLWPQSENIQAAAARLTLMHSHEVRDWSEWVEKGERQLINFILYSVTRLTLKTGKILEGSRYNFLTRMASQRTKIFRVVSWGNNELGDLMP